jgi:hypothetical protein
LFTTKNQQWHLWIEIILLVAWMIMNHVCLKCNLTSTAFSEALWNASDIIVGCSPLLSKLRHCFSKAPAKTTTAQPKYSSTFSHHARTFIVHFTLQALSNHQWPESLTVIFANSEIQQLWGILKQHVAQTAVLWEWSC